MKEGFILFHSLRVHCGEDMGIRELGAAAVKDVRQFVTLFAVLKQRGEYWCSAHILLLF